MMGATAPSAPGPHLLVQHAHELALDVLLAHDVTQPSSWRSPLLALAASGSSTRLLKPALAPASASPSSLSSTNIMSYVLKRSIARSKLSP